MTTDVAVHPRIRSEHLARKSIVYLRQSSPQQVRDHVESQRLQYALAGRARELGWTEVEVLDGDLGASASLGAAQRRSFEQLLGAVAAGGVGVVLSRELSRLSRTDQDWCRLLEICQVFGTLVGDEQHIYDLDVLDDQLILGIKGTLSVVEIKTLNLRMVQGQLAKARRGELRMRLPSGYVHDAASQVVKDPDARVREAVELIFRKFREVGSIQRTFKWFVEQRIELPIQEAVGGRVQKHWRLPTLRFVIGVLHNPCYAGVYFYGRRPQEKRVVDGRVVKRTGSVRSPEQCKVFLRDHHEGYIDWESFEENQRMIRRNAPQVEPGAVRDGQALMVGLFRCGHCGRKLHVRYWAGGSPTRYQCKGDVELDRRRCIGFGGQLVDLRMSEELMRVLSPLGLDASLEALEKIRSGRDEREQVLVRQVEQLDYEAQRAFEQYDEVDPRHRLVAAELERRWNDKLGELDGARRALAQVDRALEQLDDQAEDRIRELGPRFAEVWNDTRCPMELKKKIVRTVIEEVVVSGEGQELRFVVHWKGGTHTRFTLDRARVAAGRRTSMEALEVIGRLAPNYPDYQIASVLNQLGLRTGQEKPWTQVRVKTARRNHSIEGRQEPRARPDVLNLQQAATYCQVSNRAIERWVKAGLIHNEQSVPFAPWEIPRSDLDSEGVQRSLERLRRTGRLFLKGGVAKCQEDLFQ